MKAAEANLLSFLRNPQQFTIPIYQRTYSWRQAECQQLWNDIIRAGNDDTDSPHFIGSIVYIDQTLSQVSKQSPKLVIDGQQRLTTISLLLEAIARQVGDGELIEGFSAEKLRHYYLLNPLEKGELHYKLLLTQTDRQTLKQIVTQKPLPTEYSILVKQNFDYFNGKVKTIGDDLEALCRGLEKLMIVDVALDRQYDNPQLIFESMNSTGRELSQADLIRNFVLMRLDPTHQEQLYTEHWREMEISFGQEAYAYDFDRFMRHYLTVKSSAGEIPKVREIYKDFKSYYERSSDDVDTLVSDLHVFADYYCAMVLGQEKDPTLHSAFTDFKELRVDVAYPLLLELYHDYSNRLLSVDEMEQAVRLVESYVFRRAVCAIPTNSLSRTFAIFTRTLDKARYMESFETQFLDMQSYTLDMQSYRRFPSDKEFREKITTRDLYNFGWRCIYYLRKLENHKRKEQVQVNGLTVEHIMPQNENLSQEWQDMLGPEWRLAHATLLHTLGNLTLTGYNPELSDRPFLEKRDMEGGFKDSPLRLNEGLRNLDKWDKEQILKRAEYLADKATEVWARPMLSS